MMHMSPDADAEASKQAVSAVVLAWTRSVDDVERLVLLLTPFKRTTSFFAPLLRDVGAAEVLLRLLQVHAADLRVCLAACFVLDGLLRDLPPEPLLCAGSGAASAGSRVSAPAAAAAAAAGGAGAASAPATPLGCGVVVATLRAHSSSIPLVRVVCRVIGSLAAEPRNAAELGAAGAATALLDALRTVANSGADSPPSMWPSLLGLRSPSRAEAAEEAFAAIFGALLALATLGRSLPAAVKGALAAGRGRGAAAQVFLLRKYQADADFVFTVCRALAMLAAGSDADAQCMTGHQSDALPPFLSINAATLMHDMLWRLERHQPSLESHSSRVHPRMS